MATLPLISSKKNDFGSLYGDMSPSEMKTSVMGVYDSGRGGVKSDFKSNLRFNNILENNLIATKQLVSLEEQSLKQDKEEDIKNEKVNIPVVKQNEKSKSDKDEKKTDTPFKEKASKHLKTGNFFKDLKTAGLTSIKNELFEMTDFEFLGMKLEDYISPLKNIREFLDVRTKGEIERDKRVDLREEIDELKDLSTSEFANDDEREILSQKLEDKKSILEQLQLDKLEDVKGLQEELLNATLGTIKSQEQSLKIQQEKLIDDEKFRIKQEELAENQISWPDNFRHIAELLEDLKEAMKKCCHEEKKKDGGSSIVAPVPSKPPPTSGPTSSTPTDGPGRDNLKKRPPKPKRSIMQRVKDGVKKGGKSLGKIGKVGGIASVLLGGFDFLNRKDEGQSNLQALSGTGSGILGGIAGFAGGTAAATALGAKIGIIGGPVGMAIGGILVGAIASMAASSLSDTLTGVGEKKPISPQQVKNSVSKNLNRMKTNQNLNKVENDSKNFKDKQSSSIVQQNNMSQGGNTSVVNVNNNGNNEKAPPLANRYQNGWGGSGIF